MGTLNVTQYQVGTNRSRANANAHRYFIGLRGTSDSGVVTRGIIYFWPTPPADTVGYIAGDLLVGMLPDVDFPGWYDILRHERPVKVYYVENASEARILAHQRRNHRRGCRRGPARPLLIRLRSNGYYP